MIAIKKQKPDTTPCKGCGKPIVWGKTREGKRIPLDPRPAVYQATQFMNTVEATRLDSAMVSHFATCPKANEFSGSSRRKP